ncbi:fibronectin type III domain-containing protein [Aquimarina sp. AU58]|uniref:fibronectin type III domain-containing protein n=1 Tax=Aquimarina sp. AU58 TaxID=1874112 RepID=UPI000D6E9001|nr:hypothetical protein [Aquimarina sp. AU58]
MAFLVSFSQENQKDEVKIVARANTGKILLRWGVTTSSAWLKANRYGYVIERYTILKKGQLVNPPIKKVITPNPLLPSPVEDWEKISETNDYAAILAQALYGESFEVEEMQQGGLASIVNKSREIEQRFSFGLFAADMSFEAAKLAALGYEDKDIVAGEEYLYIIQTAVPESLLKIKEGKVSVKTSGIEPLPPPVDLIAVPRDRSIMLTWEYDLFRSIYTSYYIERSEDGTNFKRLGGDTPLVNLNDSPENPAKRMFYIDTLSQNNKKYYYRVLGISPFGEQSGSSKVVAAEGVKELTAIPYISKHKIDDSGNIIISWDFKKEAENEISRFELNWAPKEKGPYKVVKSDLPPNSRTSVYTQPEESNYFRVVAIGKNNQSTSSLTAFVQTVDSLPPAPPVGLQGVIDTLGIVKLNWTANLENDMLGYRVFRGNLKNDELSQITIAPIVNNSFVDTVQVKSLNDKVFYQVVAVDKRYNMSGYSDLLELKKPNVVPPSSPVFSGYKVNNSAISLTWINSTSANIKNHLLYRKNVEKSEWKLLFKTDTVSTYTDAQINPGIKYRYAIYAENEAGIQSVSSTPITVTSRISVDEDFVKGFTVIPDRTNNKIVLNWRKTSAMITEILIYKSKKEEKPTLWKQLPGSINKLADESVSPNNTYVYQIKAISNKGNHSKLKKKEVKF